MYFYLIRICVCKFTTLLYRSLSTLDRSGEMLLLQDTSIHLPFIMYGRYSYPLKSKRGGNNEITTAPCGAAGFTKRLQCHLLRPASASRGTSEPCPFLSKMCVLCLTAPLGGPLAVSPSRRHGKAVAQRAESRHVRSAARRISDSPVNTLHLLGKMVDSPDSSQCDINIAGEQNTNKAKRRHEPEREREGGGAAFFALVGCGSCFVWAVIPEKQAPIAPVLSISQGEFKPNAFCRGESGLAQAWYASTNLVSTAKHGSPSSPVLRRRHNKPKKKRQEMRR